jgi:hypothetical protein
MTALGGRGAVGGGAAGWLAAGILLLGACGGGGGGTPRAVAERFLDAHYVHIDLPASRAYTEGLAQRKVDDEIRLTSGQGIDGATRMPRVHYRLREEQIRGEDVVSYAYDTTFRVDGADPLHRTVQLTIRRSAEGWKVTNYDEY